MRLVRSIAVVLAAFASSCGGPAIAPDAFPVPPRDGPPPRPSACIEVPAGGALQPHVDAAPEGAALCLAPGRHLGPLRLAHRRTIYGPPEAVLRSSGVGTTVWVEAAGSRLLGFTIDGSGSRFELDDAAVKVRADDVEVRGLEIRNAIFGILVERVRRVSIVGNDIEGHRAEVLGLRGDAIRLWETRDSVVRANRVRHGRDVVLWYSSQNRFQDNVIEGGRYGSHLMFSHENLVAGNRFRGNIVGTFIMYSDRVTIERNSYVDQSTSGGMGIGIKEATDVDVIDNGFVHCTTAIFVDTSPLQRGHVDRIEGNEFALSEVALEFQGRAEGNRIRRNAFRSNREDVDVEGGGNALDADFDGNYFDRYAGYDLDGDGIGDVAHEQRSLANELTSRSPQLEFFRGTPALGIVDAAGKLVPLFTPQTLLRDPHPLVEPPTRRSRHAHRAP